MIRFIDLTHQIYCDEHMLPEEQQRPFAFYDTCVDKFVEICGCQTWESLEDFEFEFTFGGWRGMPIERFTGLLPDWHKAGGL